MQNNNTELSENINSATQRHILVIDDEISVALFITELLTNKGYKVSTIHKSNEALSFFMQHHNEIDLVITDQTMPEISGSELAQIMLIQKPDLPIFLITGYSEEIDSEKAKQMGITEFINKPFKLSEFSLLLQMHLP